VNALWAAAAVVAGQLLQLVGAYARRSNREAAGDAEQ
jgi:hypothetical protein